MLGVSGKSPAGHIAVGIPALAGVHGSVFKNNMGVSTSIS